MLDKQTVSKNSNLIHLFRMEFPNVINCHRNNANTIASEIAAKQTVINEDYVFFNKISPYSDILLKNT